VNGNLLRAAVVGALCGLSFGFDTAVIAPAARPISVSRNGPGTVSRSTTPEGDRRRPAEKTRFSYSSTWVNLSDADVERAAARSAEPLPKQTGPAVALPNSEIGSLPALLALAARRADCLSTRPKAKVSGSLDTT
jgi:hypothetical protein